MLSPGHGMEWKMEWNGTEISVWNMEDARMEWNGRFREWNGRQSSILPYQFHTIRIRIFFQNGMEWKISRMEWKTIFHTSIPIPY